MLESISIINFQAHQKLDIEFDPHITTIVGPTDQGKSSVIRALKWVLLNQAPPDFTTWGQQFSKIELNIDGQTILRKKGQGNNYYTLGSGEPFDAVGRDVPTTIAQLLNVSEINFQEQMDGPYWLCETPGEVGRQLNQIVDLGIIDNTLSNIAGQLREARAEVKVCENRLKDTKTKKKELAWVPVAWEELQTMILAKEENNAQASRIANLALQIEKVRQGRETVLNASTQAGEASKCLVLADKARQLAGRVKNLEISIRNIKNLHEEVGKWKLLQDKAEKELHEKMGGVCPICGSTMTS